MEKPHILTTSVKISNIRLTKDLFLTCMASVYMFAFASLFLQTPGLYGSKGLQPAHLVIKNVPESFSDLLSQMTLLRYLPSLGVSDTRLGMDLLCIAGILLSFLAFISQHMRNTFTFFTLWLLYLSVFQVGQRFLWFQWDTLLLETGFLTLVVAPLSCSRSFFYYHDRITLWLVRWLAFRLMFASGVVKLTSNCPTWWGLTAMTYHYESQCIPAFPAWYFHQLPTWFHRLSVVVVYVIEIPLPFLFFSPVKSQRIFAFYSQVLLMGLIALTGNYNFFNLLTAVLFISLLDDDWLLSWRKKSQQKFDKERKDDKTSSAVSFSRTCFLARLVFNVIVYGSILYATVRLFTIDISLSDLSIHSRTAFNQNDLAWFLARAVPISIWIGIISLAVEIFTSLIRTIRCKSGNIKRILNLCGTVVFGITAIGLFCISLVPYTDIESGTQERLPRTVKLWHYSTARSVQLTNAYGLFRSMTGVGGRPELIVEGSNSMEGPWQEYNFLYKPGSLDRRPPFIAPHQPRLDWQMWFAALGTYEHNPWFLNFVYRLLKNEKEVIQLIDKGPFDNAPPKYIRAQLYHYHYTSFNQSSGSEWWVRNHVRQYLPIVWADEPGFVAYLKKANIYEDVAAKPVVKSESVLKSVVDYLHDVFTPADGLNLCIGLLISALAYKFIKGFMTV